jgi:hypothetical protein
MDQCNLADLLGQANTREASGQRIGLRGVGRQLRGRDTSEESLGSQRVRGTPSQPFLATALPATQLRMNSGVTGVKTFPPEGCSAEGRISTQIKKGMTFSESGPSSGIHRVRSATTMAPPNVVRDTCRGRA